MANVIIKPEDASLTMDFSAAAAGLRPVEPTLSPDDHLETLARKMRGMADVVLGGASVAVVTKEIKPVPERRDPEREAVGLMTRDERFAYCAWKQGRVRFLGFNWAHCVAPGPTSDDERREYEEYATEMDVLWRHRGTTVENVAWVKENDQYLFDVTKAVAKAAKWKTGAEQVAEQAEFTKQGEPLAIEKAELRVLREVCKTARNRQTEILQEQRRLAQSIDDSIDAIQAHADALESKMLETP